MRQHRHTTRLCRGFAALLCLVATASCAPMIDTRGNLPAPERLSQIQPGQQMRDEVAQILGTPSTLSAFGDPVWYYVSYRTETTGFFAPKEVERKIVAVHFDERGYVKDVQTRGLEDAAEVKFVERETPTAGKDMSILQQFLGNIGRFESDNSGMNYGHNIPR